MDLQAVWGGLYWKNAFVSFTGLGYGDTLQQDLHDFHHQATQKAQERPRCGSRAREYTVGQSAANGHDGNIERKEGDNP